MLSFLENLSPVWLGMGFVYTILSCAGVFTLLVKNRIFEELYRDLKTRIKTWFWIIATISAALALGDKATIIFLGFVSFLAFKEFLSMIPTRPADRRVLFWAYLFIPVQYYFVYTGYYNLFVIAIPVYAFLLLSFRQLLTQQTDGFIRSAGMLQWGLMLSVYNISHLAFLFSLKLDTPFNGGGNELFFYVVFLTQFNDVAQYCWGKTLGKHKIVPKVSPKKTWEGFIGGVVTTTVLAVVLAPVFTPFSLPLSIIAGVLISCLGFVGDLTMSAVKRDLNMKDSGSFLPGHGGILDRLDSLTLNAPLFLHFTRFFYGV